MPEWFRKPYPFLFETLKIRLRVAIFVFLFVFLFLSVFKPFDIEKILAMNVYVGCLLYALTSGIGVLVTGSLLVQLFPNYFSDKNWTIGKELISTNTMLLAVSIFNGVLGHYIEICPPGVSKSLGSDIANNLVHTYAVGLFPVAILTAVSYIVFLRRNLARVAENNKQIGARQEEPAPDESHDRMVTVQSSSNNNDFSFRLNDLLFVMSDGNYVEFHLEEAGNVRREIRRNTLSNIESQLETYQFLFRSHRAYLVNLKKVVNSSGNAQGYELKFEKSEHTVPVSRRNLARFDQLINS